ncbi:MAG: TasA family protein [Acidimicrobiales bacterium]
MTTTLAPPDPGTLVAPRRRLDPMRVGLTLAAVLVAIAMATVLSLALFTDSADVSGNSFSTGSVNIGASPASAALSLPTMTPGDQDTAPITVSNGGSLDLRYAVRSTTTENVLAAALVLTVKTGVVTCDDANWSASGTTLYSGSLGSVGGTAVFGSPATGGQAGDRTLAPGASEVLCVNVTLPVGATTGEGLSTTATFSFLAEQTANNP